MNHRLKILLGFFLVCFSPSPLQAQWSFNYTFEDTSHDTAIYTDSLDLGNLWQIGSPNKSVFIGGFASPNAIVTDTVNPYPINDTSSFFMRQIAGEGFALPHTVFMTAYYNVNSDSLNDYGIIEFSYDNGTTWIDLLNDTVYGPYVMWGNRPILTGNSFGWKQFGFNLANFGPLFSIQDGDTVLYKFSFFSDSIDTNKDGLMYDSFFYTDYAESIDEYQNNNLFSVFPNPSNGSFRVRTFSQASNAQLTIFNSIGEKIFEKNNPAEEIELNLSYGLYLIRYSVKNEFSVKRIVIQK